jgi:hypothetical protein
VPRREHYNYFRDYDPAIGRYMESDPIGLIGGLNTYGYVKSNPLLSQDFMGLATATFPGFDIPLPGWLGGAGTRLLGVAGVILSLGGDTSQSTESLEECEAKCEEDKKARDALCFIEKAKGGKAAQRLCLSRSDAIAFECRKNCKNKCPRK